MASCIQAMHSEVHASGSKPPFLRTAAQVVSSDEPRTKREQVYREASPSLPFEIDASAAALCLTKHHVHFPPCPEPSQQLTPRSESSAPPLIGFPYIGLVCGAK